MASTKARKQSTPDLSGISHTSLVYFLDASRIRLLRRIGRRCWKGSDPRPDEIARWVLDLALLRTEETVGQINAWVRWRSAEGFPVDDSSTVISHQLTRAAKGGAK